MIISVINKHGYAVEKIVNDELIVTERVLYCGCVMGTISTVLNVINRNAEHTSHWMTKVRTTLVRATQPTHIKDAFHIKASLHMAPKDILYVPAIILLLMYVERVNSSTLYRRPRECRTMSAWKETWLH